MQRLQSPNFDDTHAFARIYKRAVRNNNLFIVVPLDNTVPAIAPMNNEIN